MRGCSGDRKAPQRIADDETIKAGALPSIKGSRFRWAEGVGFQRPVELATLRLRNMAEVLAHRRTDVPRDDVINQRVGVPFCSKQMTACWLRTASADCWGSP